MSIDVPLTELAAEVDRRGWGYLLTVSESVRPHLLALTPHLLADADGPVLRFVTGDGRAFRNSAERPQVSIVFPPVERSDGYSLVVDGDATAVDGEVTVRPTRAVLHRPAP